MVDPSPTKDALAALLVKVITGVEGGTEAHWTEVIGEVERLPIIGNVHSNWAIRPRGSRRDRDVAARAAEIVRQAHPYVTG